MLKQLIKPAQPIWSNKLKKLSVKAKYGKEWNRLTLEMLKRKSFFDAFNFRIDMALVNYILFIGEIGMGKSNSSIWLAKELSKIKGRKFSLKKNIYIGRDVDLTLQELVEKHKPGEVILIEEAQYVINSLRATSDQNKETANTFDSVRDYDLQFILNAPSLTRLDNYIVNEEIDWLFICEWRSKQRQEVDAIVEYNAKTRRLDYREYVPHSEMKIPYITVKEYKRYRKIKHNKIYTEKGRTTFKEARQSREAKRRRNKEIDVIGEFHKLINESKFKLGKLLKRSRKEDLEGIAKRSELIRAGHGLGIPKGVLAGIFGVSDSTINSAIALGSIEEKKREGE